MTGYIRTILSVRSFGLEHLRLEPSTILAPNHRSDNDVPLLASVLAPYWFDGASRGMPWPTFATDDHAFFRGFLAGYPPDLPLAMRRLLWPIRVGGVLEAQLQCVPVRRPMQMRLVELLRRDPERPLDGRLPAEVSAALFQRAGELGHHPPLRASDVLNGGFADVLWTPIDRDLTTDCEDIWRAHQRNAVGDFRRLVLTLRSGGTVVLFPEGQLSPDGDVGPLLPGLASLARRGRARLVQPVAISYDPLTLGRTRAYVSVAPVLEPLPGKLGRQVTQALRRAIPLTAGQIAATVVSEYGSPRSLRGAGAEWISRARADGRPIEPSLTGSRRHLVLAEAYRHARRRGRDDRVIRSLARELESAHSS